MPDADSSVMRVAFIVDIFPAISESFIINQVADLLDRNVEVEVFAFKAGVTEFISSRYSDKIARRVHHFESPRSKGERILRAIPLILRILSQQPMALVRALNFIKYGRSAWSLDLLYMCAPFVGRRFHLIHCHFGHVANRFLVIKDVLQLNIPFVTTLYGYDASAVFVTQPANFYDRLKKACALFFVMSDDMKKRVIAHGFPAEKVRVHPVSIEVDAYLFSERRCPPDHPVEILFVGRFVEKKGADDLIRALAVARRLTTRVFRCTIVGGGAQEQMLRTLVSTLGLEDRIQFKGYMRNEDIIQMLSSMHLMVQPSKTASNGDME